MEILTAVLVLTGLGLAAGILLAYFSKVFYVKEDPRIEQIEAVLPSANCGACGYAGCRDFAKAVANGSEAVCPVGGTETSKLVAAILGQEAAEVERQVALVRCAGTTERAAKRAELMGVKDCRSASLLGSSKLCRYGCMGYGDCVRVCPADAISIYKGHVAIVEPDKCIGCGLCVEACPLGIIEMVPASRKVHVLCNSKDPALITKQVCSVGCISCKLCSRKDSDFVIADNLATFKGTETDETVPFVCPNDVIVDTRKYSVKAFIESRTARADFEKEKAEFKEKEKAERAKKLAAKKAAAQKAAAAKKAEQSSESAEKSVKTSENESKKQEKPEVKKEDSEKSESDKKEIKTDKSEKKEDKENA